MNNINTKEFFIEQKKKLIELKKGLSDKIDILNEYQKDNPHSKFYSTYIVFRELPFKIDKELKRLEEEINSFDNYKI